MGRKHVVQLDLFKDISPLAMNAQLISREIDVSELDKASIHCYWTAGPTGEFQVQVKQLSLYPQEDAWSTLESGAPWTVAAGDSEAQIVLTEVPFVTMRLIWNPNVGTSAILTAYLTIKSVGA